MVPVTIQSLFDCIWKSKKMISFLVAASIVFCALALNIVSSTTASVIIKFVGDDAENGLTENGMEIDPYEISSALVIENAALTLGYENVNTEPIRRNMTITPITSTAEREKYASWIENFSDYDKTEEEKKSPVYYAVSLKTNENEDYARNMLYSIVQSYRQYYTTKYTYHFNIANLEENVYTQYDYYETIDLLNKKIEENIKYLNNIIASDFNYRSHKMGFSIKDIADRYGALKNTELSNAEQTVLENKLSKNYPLLINNLESKIIYSEQIMSLNKQKANSAKELMEAYAEKNEEYLWDRFNTEDNQSDQVRGDIERDDEYAQYKSTYDQLMMDYVKYRTDYENARLDKEKYEKVLASFQSGSQQNIENTDIENRLTDICNTYSEISEVTKEVINAYNKYRESKSVIAVSGVIVDKSANAIFYYAVCVVMALAVGILISIAKEMYFMHLKKKHPENGEQI